MKQWLTEGTGDKELGLLIRNKCPDQYFAPNSIVTTRMVVSHFCFEIQTSTFFVFPFFCLRMTAMAYPTLTQETNLYKCLSKTSNVFSNALASAKKLLKTPRKHLQLLAQSL